MRDRFPSLKKEWGTAFLRVPPPTTPLVRRTNSPWDEQSTNTVITNATQPTLCLPFGRPFEYRHLPITDLRGFNILLEMA